MIIRCQQIPFFCWSFCGCLTGQQKKWWLEIVDTKTRIKDSWPGPLTRWAKFFEAAHRRSKRLQLAMLWDVAQQGNHQNCDILLWKVRIQHPILGPFKLHAFFFFFWPSLLLFFSYYIWNNTFKYFMYPILRVSLSKHRDCPLFRWWLFCVSPQGSRFDSLATRWEQRLHRMRSTAVSWQMHLMLILSCFLFLKLDMLKPYLAFVVKKQ